jgi:serine/threonine-protein kinase
MIHQGAGMAVACAVLTAGISGVAALGVEVLPGASPWGLVDAAFCAAMAFGIFRGSRACAALMLVYWLTAKALEAANGDVPPPAIGAGVAAAYYYVNALRGTFRLRAFERGVVVIGVPV